LDRRVVPTLSPISSTAGNPFTAIVELRATFPDHMTYVGSGVMVDSFHVLTAGHVVYSYKDGGFASSIIATPELYGSYQPFGIAYATYTRTFTTFVNYNRTHPGLTTPGDLDVGLITLDRTIGNVTGWMSYGYDNNNADFSPGTVYNTAGYPASGGYDGLHMEFSAGAIAGLSPDGSALEYYQSSITGYGGQSGSPVWRYTPSTGSRVVYAVHVGGSGAANSLNIATRITQSIFNSLQSWQRSDFIPQTYAVTTDASQTARPAQAVGIASPSPIAVAPTALTRAGVTTAPTQVTPAPRVEAPAVIATLEAHTPVRPGRRHLALFDLALEGLLTQDEPFALTV
jgi:V8-like Glu-specific endopeptidase